MDIKRLLEELKGFEDMSKEFKNVPNNVKIGEYILYNPVAHEGKFYITLGSNSFGYLKAVNGVGYITSGREGHNPNEPSISHGSGDKVDVVYSIGYDMDYGKWAKLAVPFLKHNKTAFVNFECFSNKDYLEIKRRIIEWYPDLKERINGLADQRANINRNSKVLYDGLENGKLKFMFNLACKGDPHLDIGIIPNSYSEDLTNLPSV